MPWYGNLLSSQTWIKKEKGEKVSHKTFRHTKMLVHDLVQPYHLNNKENPDLDTSVTISKKNLKFKFYKKSCNSALRSLNRMP